MHRDPLLLSLLQDNHGKSLLEIIVVLSISSILATAAIYRYAGNADASQRQSAVKVVVNDLRYAKEMAMASGKSVKVIVTPVQNSYKIVWAGSGVALKRPVGGGILARTFGDGEFRAVKISSTQLVKGALVLKPDGTPFTGGSAIQSKQKVMQIKAGKSIYIYPVTGRLVSE